MKLKEIYENQKIKNNTFFQEKIPVVSFEIFPPKCDIDGSKMETLFAEIEQLKKYNPSLISLTYGAGGSNREYSLDILKALLDREKVSIMPHFTCICSSKEYIDKYLEDVCSLNIENILALRGDEPKEIDVCYKDFRYANELVEYIKSKTDLSVAVAGYPEGHIDAKDLYSDIEMLKRKVDAGAEVIFTQLFFDNDKYHSYIQLIRDAGIDIPVVAGVLPIISYQVIEKMLSMAKVTVPKNLMTNLEKYKDNPDDFVKMGIDFATYQCQQLIDSGVKGLHFYTLNKAHSTSAILENLSLI